MNGTIQIIVNLRSRSVEHSREDTLVNRNSCVLRSDAMIASDFHEVDAAFVGETDYEKVIRSVKSIQEMGRYVGDLKYFQITRGGNKVYIHPEDISFVTIEATDDLGEIK